MSKLWIEGGIRAPQNPGGGLNIDNWSFALVKKYTICFLFIFLSCAIFEQFSFSFISFY